MEIFLTCGWILMAFITFGGLTIAIQKRQIIKICMSIPLVFLLVGFFFIMPAPALLTAVGLKPLIGRLYIKQIALVSCEASFYASGLVVFAGLVMIVIDCYKAIKKKISKRQLERATKTEKPWYLVSEPFRSTPKGQLKNSIEKQNDH